MALNESQLNNLIVRRALQRRGTLRMNMLGGFLGIEASNFNFLYRNPREGNATHYCILRASLVVQRLKHLPAMQETWV